MSPVTWPFTSSNIFQYQKYTKLLTLLLFLNGLTCVGQGVILGKINVCGICDATCASSHFFTFVCILWPESNFFGPICTGFSPAKAAQSPCGSGPSCAASITRGLALPVRRYAQARSVYAPLEMTDGMDSC